MRKFIQEWHCRLCGCTDQEWIDTSDDPEYQGYSRCCNESVVDGQDCNDQCAHGEDF